MKYSKNFEDKVLEFIEEQKDFNKKIDSRLDTIEKRLDVIESLPTIQKEMSNKKKSK